MKKEAVFGIALAILISLGLFFSILTISIAQPTNITFTVNLTISGNADPSISWVQTGISANPIESAARVIYVAFNVTDNNGYADIDYSSAKVTLSLNGEPHRVSASCINYANSTLTMHFNCSVSLQYYDSDGTWNINASVRDLSTAYDEDTGASMTYGQLQALRANLNGITFGSVTLGQQTGASNDPLVLNNTGNQNFTMINVTAYNLVGQTIPSQYISASSIYINASQDNFGNSLANGTSVRLTNATLPRDANGIENNRNIYFWVNVPGSGLSNQIYVSSSNWTIDVYP